MRTFTKTRRVLSLEEFEAGMDVGNFSDLYLWLLVIAEIIILIMYIIGD